MVDTWGFIAIMVGIALGLALVWALKSRKLDGETLSGIAELLESMPFPTDNSPASMIARYAKTAVLTVEQMVKTGKIAKDDETRKNTALDIVKTAARVDGLQFGQEEGILASSCIEAEVNMLPRNAAKGAIGVLLADEWPEEEPEEDPEEDKLEEEPEEVPEDATGEMEEEKAEEPEAEPEDKEEPESDPEAPEIDREDLEEQENTDAQEPEEDTPGDTEDPPDGGNG